MIENTSIGDETLLGLLDLVNCPALFYPCGSRFFGDAKEDSDFDFFIAHSESIVSHLLGKLWQKSSRYDYRDINSIEILWRGKVTIITVRSVEKRKALQRYVRDNGISRPKGNVEFWDNLYAMLERGEIK